MKLLDILTKATEETEGLLPGQTPLRIQWAKGKEKTGKEGSPYKNTVQGIPIDWKAWEEAPEERKNFYFVKPEQSSEVIRRQWKSNFQNPSRFNLNENSTVEDVIRKFDQERPENKLKILQDEGIDIKQKIKGLDLSFLNPFKVEEAEAATTGPIKWSAISSDKRYQTADPIKRKAIQDKYFDTFIKPNPQYRPELELKIREDLFKEKKGLVDTISDFITTPRDRNLPPLSPEAERVKTAFPAITKDLELSALPDQPAKTFIQKAKDFLTNAPTPVDKATDADAIYIMSKLTGERPSAISILTQEERRNLMRGTGIESEPTNTEVYKKLLGATGITLGAMAGPVPLLTGVLKYAAVHQAISTGVKLRTGKDIWNLDEATLSDLTDPNATAQQKEALELLQFGGEVGLTGLMNRKTIQALKKGYVEPALKVTAETAKETIDFAITKIQQGVEARRLKADFIDQFSPKVGRENAVKAANELELAIKEMQPGKEITPDYLAKRLFGIERPGIEVKVEKPAGVVLPREVIPEPKAPIVKEVNIADIEALKAQMQKPTVLSTPIDLTTIKDTLTKSEHLFTAEQALTGTYEEIDDEGNKQIVSYSPMKLQERWYNSQELTQSITGPAQEQINALKEQLGQLKGQRGKEIAETKKDIQSKIDAIEKNAMAVQEMAQEEGEKFSTDLTNLALDEAKKQGLDLGEEEQAQFSEDIGRKIFDDRGYVEGQYEDKETGEIKQNYTRPILEIIQESIDEWKQSTSPEALAQSQEEQIKRQEEIDKKLETTPTEGKVEELPADFKNQIDAITDESRLEEIRDSAAYTKEYRQYAQKRLKEVIKEQVKREVKLEKKADTNYSLVGYYDTAGSTEKDESEYGNLLPEKKFKKDLEKFSKALATELGWEHDTDKKGKKIIASTNIAPIGGDGYIILWKPNSEWGIYISIDADRVNGDDLELGGTMGKGAAILYRATTKKDKYGGQSNNFASSDITVGKLAELAKKTVNFYETPIAEEKPPLTKEKPSDILKVEEKDVKREAERIREGGQAAPGRSADVIGRPSGGEPAEGGGGLERRLKSVQSEVKQERSKVSSGTSITGKQETTEAQRKANLGNYQITDDDQIGIGTPKVKYQNNISAIKLLKILEKEKRLATPLEQAILVKYVGWGGLSKVFDRYSHEGWDKEFEELETLLTDEEYKAARASTINAHYTSQEIIESMWKAVISMGFKGGKVLEPGMGIGHFLGLRPDGVNCAFTGVELDSLTGRIAKQLYQNSDIYIDGFEKVNLSRNFYDLAISNVPFADYKPYDPKAKFLGIPSGLMLHDYFFAKALVLVKPGGIIAFITSKGTMDKQEPKLREWISKQADLIGAIRLPRTAFKATAGTEVVTDIIFLQKRREGQKPSGEAWINSTLTKISNRNVNVSEYFLKNTTMVLGNMKVGKGLYTENELTVEPFTEPLIDSLNKAIDYLAKNIVEESVDVEAERPEERVQDSSNAKMDSFVLKEGKIYQKTEDGLVLKEFGTDKDRLIGMMQIRDALRDFLAHQEANADKPTLLANQQKLNTVYDKFVKKYGYLNSAKNEDLFWDDPDSNLIVSLENEQKKTKTYSKAAIFTEFTNLPHVQPIQVNTAEDSVYVSLSEYGHLNWEYMAKITGKVEEDLQKELSEANIIYKNPEGEKWELADEYLSGNVKLKLKLAEAALRIDPVYAKNIEILRNIIPADKTFQEITVRLGTPWIEAKDYIKFVSELLDVSSYNVKIEHNTVDGRWNFNLESWAKRSATNTEQWGIERYPAIDLMEAIANHRTIQVKDKVMEEGAEKTVINEQETAIAQDKAEILKQKFQDWFWQDEERRTKYIKLYNDNYNTNVTRKYNGDFLTLPGLSSVYELRKTQKDAIWRVVQNHNTLLAHEVGAGKTLIVICGLMESKRLGIINKPMVVVPKNTLGQWKREWNKLYPAANILVADERNFVTTRRKRFLSKIATGNYDAIVLADSSFNKIGVSEELKREYIQEQLDELRAIKEKYQEDGSKNSVKQIEKSIKKYEERLEKKLDQTAKDENIAFEELGIDTIAVDEADRFKNLAYQTKMENVRGLGDPSGNLRTEDLMMKSILIRRKLGKMVFATGTPVSNTMAEVHTMMRYLQPDLLEEKGLKHFDDWSNAFGEVVASLEVDATGGRYKTVSRFSKFVNLPELMTMLREVWDIQTAAMLEEAGILVKGVNLPLIKGGKPTVVVLNPTTELQEYVQELGRRAEAIKGKRVEKGGDNMLVILHDGIIASTDMRLIDPALPGSSNSKIEYSINGIYERWNSSKSIKGTQIIFIDRTAPDKLALFNPHYYMRKKLVEMGIPDKEIAFIHDYDTLDKKDDLYEKVNNGDIRVLFGSTEKLGAGTNVQTRLICEWHIDTPFRPRDIMQREGRIVRPGNTNKEVEIMRLVTKGSLDTFMWQMLEAKVKSISQVMSGESKDRVLNEEVDEYSIIKAASSDNPLLREKVEVDKEVRRLTNLRNAFLDQKFKAQEQIKRLPEEIERLKTTIEGIKQDIAKRPIKLTKETFTINIGDNTYKTKEEAHVAIKQVVDKITVPQWGKEYIPLGKYQGFQLFVFVQPPSEMNPRITKIIIRGAGQYESTYSDSAIGTFASIDTALYTHPEARLNQLEGSLDNSTKNLVIVKKLAEKNFEHQDKLEEKQKRQVEITRKMKEETEGKQVEMHAGVSVFPHKKAPVVNDNIETGECKFIDPEIEARFKAAHGQTPATLKSKIGEWWSNFIKSAVRVYPELPNDPKYAQIREILKQQTHTKTIAQEQAFRYIDDILLGFGPKKMDLFTRAVILADLTKEAESGRPIPFGYSSYDEGGNLYTNKDLLAKDKENIDRLVEANPDVKEALEKRKTIWKDITDKLVYYKILSSQQIKEDYFRHQVLDYANVKATFGIGRKLKKPTPGYARRRFGSAEHDINTNYLEAEFEVMSQALNDIQTARHIDQIRYSPLNIKERLKEEARDHNKKMSDQIVVPGMTDKEGNPVTITDILKPFSQKMGFGFATLSKLGYEFDKDDPEVFNELVNITNDENASESAKMAAGMILKASAQRKQAMRKMLGVNYKEWSDLIPVGYTTWQPKEGRVFFSVMKVSQKIVNQVLENIDIEGISKEDLTKILAVGPMREEFVLPEEVAKTLDNLYEIKPTNFIYEGAKFLTTQWKKWVLFNPRRLTKYNYQNFLGDLDGVIAGQPKILKNMGRATDELIKMFYRGQVMSPEMREFFERGGFKSEMTIQEIPEINNLELYDKFRTNSEKAFDLIGQKNILHEYWNKAVEFTVFRETILRYAAYLYYRDIFTSGQKEYGASIKSEVDGLSDPLDKAAKVATELLGDYGTITALGKSIRETIIPFYSWLEINFKRYKRLAQNSFDDGFASGLGFVGRAGASGASRATIMGSLFLLKWLLRASLMTMAVALYNHIFHEDEERELNPYDQNRMHIVIGRDKKGNVRIVRGQGAFSDLFEWVGLDKAYTMWKDYIDGKESLVDMFGKIPFVTGKLGLKQVMLKFLRGINPLYKLPVEIATGKTLWGLDEQSGVITDKIRNVFRALQLENEYDWITKKPTRGYFKSLEQAFITTTDPEENAFRYIQGQKHAFKEKKGKGGSGDYYTPRSVVYRQYRKALSFGDERARVAALKELQKMGVTVKELERSLATQAPLYGLNHDEKIEFVNNYLSTRDRELLRRAQNYYKKVFKER